MFKGGPASIETPIEPRKKLPYVTASMVRPFVGTQQCRSCAKNNVGIPALERIMFAFYVQLKSQRAPRHSLRGRNSGALAMLQPILSSKGPHTFASYSITIFKVAPGDTLCFNLVFRPLRPGEHSFQLPLSLEGIPPDGSTHLRNPVSAAGLRPTLTFTSTEVDFGRRVVSRDPCGLNQYQGEFSLRNASDKVSQGRTIRNRAFGFPTRHGNRFLFFLHMCFFLGAHRMR